MKIAPFNVLLPFVIASVATVPASAAFLDFFDNIVLDIFGNGNDEEAEPSSPANSNNAAEYVELNLRQNQIIGPVMDRLGDYATGKATNEIAQGKRAYDCLTQISDESTNGRSGPARKKFQFKDEAMQLISYGVTFQIFESTEDIDVICPPEDEVRRLTAAEMTSSQKNLRRRTQEQATGVEPAYPSLDPADIRMSWNKYVSVYAESEDLNNRTAIGELVYELNSQIAVYNTAAENLALAGEWVSTLGEFISTVQPEAGIAIAGAQVDFGAFIRGLSGLLTNLAMTLDRNISRRQRTLAILENHKSLIDSAEIEAGFKNTRSMVAEISALKQQVESLQARL